MSGFQMADGKYRVASMFAGIGGIDIGFRNAGADIVWANEIDHNACRTYCSNLPDIKLVEGDIRNIEIPIDVNVDILCAGFPCQAFSMAGHRKGLDDPRGALFRQVIRIAKEKNVRAIFCENVKYLLKLNKGKTYKTIKSELMEAGYTVREKVLNTCKYGNIPQNRERVYMVAFRNECDGSKPFEFEFFRYPRPIKPSVKIPDIVKPSDKKDNRYYYSHEHKYYAPLDEAIGKGGIDNDDNISIYQWRRTYVRKNMSKMCPTLTANMGGGGHNVPIIRDRYDIRRLTPEECLAFQGFPPDFRFPDDMAEGQKYKQAGNSVSVPVIERIAKNMISAMNKADSIRRVEQ